MRLALVASAHGFGHVTRLLAVAERLRARGHEPTLVTAAPRQLVEETLPGAVVVSAQVDVGLKQADSLTEDPVGTAALLDARASETALAALGEILRPFDRVVCDTAPTALEAARRVGVEALALGNFDWAWTYRHYPPLHSWADRFGAWQRPHTGLSLWPGPGLREFDHIEPVGLVGRQAPPHRVADRAVLVSFGGLGLADLDRLLPRIEGITWVLAPPMAPLDRPDCVWVSGVPYPALVAGADLVFTKPGYGILAESLLAGTGVVWADRGAFPEAAFLEQVLQARGDQKVAVPASHPGFSTALAQSVCARLATSVPPCPRRSQADAIAARLLRA